MSPPEVSVVVPSHDRPVTLRWLLNALEEQTLASDRFEVVVVHDSDDETENLLTDHPLAAAGRLRHRRLEPGTGRPSRQRNVGWRLARAPLIAFTDDDCRPHPGWLEELLRTAGDHPGAIVQGATKPDPYAEVLLTVPHSRSLDVDPPGLFAQTCNILYPRTALEAVGGFDEQLPSAAGEDTDLAWRARDAGRDYVGAPDALVWHAVTTPGLVGRLRGLGRWQHVVLVVQRHPQLRTSFPLRVFWRRSHALLLLVGLPGLALARRHPLFALALLPWLAELSPAGRPGVRGLVGRLRRTAELAVVDAAEIGVLARGSARYRTLFL